MPHKTCIACSALTLTLAALLTATQAIAAPKTEGKNGAVKPAPKTLPPFCAAPPGGEPPRRATTSCVSGTKPAYIAASHMWACCRHDPNDS